MSLPPDQEHDDRGAKRSSEADILAGWYRMAGVGIEFVVAIALFAAIGYGIDRWLDSSPWGVLIGLGVGFTVGLRAMIRAARRAFKQ